MGDNNYWDNDDNDNDDGSGKGLRAQLEKALADLKKSDARAVAAERKVAVIDAGKFLESKGRSPKLARFAANDGVDISDSKALEKWLDENGSDFADSQTSEQTDLEAQVTDTGEQDLEADEAAKAAAAAQVRLTGLHNQASPETLTKFQLAEKNLSEDASPEQVLKEFRASGL